MTEDLLHVRNEPLPQLKLLVCGPVFGSCVTGVSAFPSPHQIYLTYLLRPQQEILQLRVAYSSLAAPEVLL